ncbi:12249_t:CDS:2, partial [Ambispora gerdemannii]
MFLGLWTDILLGRVFAGSQTTSTAIFVDLLGHYNIWICWTLQKVPGLFWLGSSCFIWETETKGVKIALRSALATEPEVRIVVFVGFRFNVEQMLASLTSDGADFSVEENDLVQGFEFFTLGTVDFEEVGREHRGGAKG